MSTATGPSLDAPGDRATAVRSTRDATVDGTLEEPRRARAGEWPYLRPHWRVLLLVVTISLLGAGVVSRHRHSSHS